MYRPLKTAGSGFRLMPKAGSGSEFHPKIFLAPNMNATLENTNVDNQIQGE